MQTKLFALVVATRLMAFDALAQAPKHSFAITTGEGPVITDADISEYRFAEHSLRIRGKSLSRVAGIRPSVSGTPFHVIADGERIYSGRFVSLMSSMSLKEPTILANVDTNLAAATVVIAGPLYHEPQFQPGTDPRIDTRVTRALAGLGKLSAGFPGGASNDEAFRRRFAEVFDECEKMAVGTTRAEFLKVFEGEGGLSSARHRTFVHRSCPYVKVDVEFALAETTQSVREERPSDPINKISKPYLARPILD
jgi:hypothetical protein